MDTCKVFGDWTSLNDPWQKFKCVDCGQFWYKIILQNPRLHYLDTSTGKISTGNYSYKLVKIEEYSCNGQ